MQGEKKTQKMNGKRASASPGDSDTDSDSDWTPRPSSYPRYRNRSSAEALQGVQRPRKTFVLPQTVQFGFHNVCSDHVKIADNGLRAEKKDPNNQYARGVVYSALPLKGTVEFEVTMTQYGTGWSGTLKLGVAKYKSGQSIQVSRIPRYSPEAPNHCVWSSDKIHNRLKSNHNGVQEKQYGQKDLDSLRQGDSLGLRLSHDGKLVFFVNGESQGLAAQEVYEKGHDVYVVVDHYANCKATEITRAGEVYNYEGARLGSLLCVRGGGRRRGLEGGSGERERVRGEGERERGGEGEGERERL